MAPFFLLGNEPFELLKSIFTIAVALIYIALLMLLLNREYRALRITGLFLALIMAWFGYGGIRYGESGYYFLLLLPALIGLYTVFIWPRDRNHPH